jgi:hypothetical protein
MTISKFAKVSFEPLGLRGALPVLVPTIHRQSPLLDDGRDDLAHGESVCYLTPRQPSSLKSPDAMQWRDNSL